MSGSTVPPPRLMGLAALGDLPGAPTLDRFPPGTLGELIITGLSGSEENLTAHVAVHVETTTALAEWMTIMPFEEFLEALPTWTLLNCPSHTGELHLVDAPSARPRRSRQSRRRRALGGSELAASWRGHGRPIRSTVEYLLASIDLVPDAAAITYVHAMGRLRGQRFDSASRCLIADICDLIATVEQQPPAGA